MSPIEASETITLLRQYKEKARCYWCEGQAISIYNELQKRLGKVYLYKLRLSVWHMVHGEGDAEFNEVIDNIIEAHTYRA